MVYAALTLGLLPGLAWLLFYLREDARHPEPKKMIIFAFLIGAASTFVAVFLEVWVSDWLLTLGVARFSNLSFLTLSFIEETVKFLAVFWLISRSRYFDEPVDAMVYLVTAALGFATVENVAAAWNQWNDLAHLGPIFETVTLRFIGATLLHSLASGLIGYYWALGQAYQESLPFILKGLVLAIIFHTVFNFLIFNEAAIIIPTMLLLFVGLFVLNDFERLKLIPSSSNRRLSK